MRARGPDGAASLFILKAPPPPVAAVVVAAAVVVVVVAGPDPTLSAAELQKHCLLYRCVSASISKLWVLGV